MHGRDGEHVANVVEAVAGIVGGEAGGIVKVEAEEVADGVAVLGFVEAMDRGGAGIGTGSGRFIKFGFEELYQGRALFGAGSGVAGGRHLPGAEFMQDLFEERGLSGYVGGGGVFQSDAGGFTRVAVTIQAVIGDGVFEKLWVLGEGGGG